MRLGASVAARSSLSIAPRLVVADLACARRSVCGATAAALAWAGHSGTHLAPRGLIAKVRDLDTALRRWELSAELTGCDWQES